MTTLADYLDPVTSSATTAPQGLSNDDIALGKQLLPYINAYEGKPSPNTIVGGQTFDDLSAHPKTKVVFNKNGDKSDAAGSYQILGSTWDNYAKKLGLTDFSPESQDLAAIAIAKDTGALDAYKAGNYAKAKQLLGTQWASIPGSTIGAATGQIPKYNPEAEKLFGQAPTQGQTQTQLSPLEQALNGTLPEQVNAEKPKTLRSVGQQFAKDIESSLGNMSWEDFKNKSLIAPAATYTAASLGIPGFTEKDKQEAAQNLQEKGKSLVQGLQNLGNMPVQQFSQNVINAGKNLIERPGLATGEAIKGTIYDPELLFAGEGINAVSKPLLAGGKGAAKIIGEAAMQDPAFAAKFAELKSSGQLAKEQMGQAFEKVKQKFNEPEGGLNVAQQPNVGAAGRNVGAAESTLQNQVQAALNEAPDYLKQSLKDVPIEKLATEQNLKAIENHNKFAKFGLVPTEGQALENTSLMSDEFNARKKDPNIQARLEERDPKLIQAFNDIKDKVSPDVFENDPARLASMPLDKVKSIYQQKEQNVSNLWKQANLASGTAQAPIDVGALRENIINGLKEKQRTRYVPAGLQADLDETLGKGFMTPEEYENFRSDTATISRTSPDPFARQAAAIIREKLEQVPIKDEFAQYKPLYDQARKATTDLHSFEKSPVVKAAISDTRTPDEIAAGMPHPAAKNFVAQHYSAKTPQVEIERMLDLIGRNSPEHQALNKLKINEFKLNSGIVNDKGTVSQQALNKQIHEQHQTNLASMFGQETAKDLRDLADVANLTEPRKGVHSVNTSNSEILREQNAREAAKEAAGNVAAGVAESAVNAKVPFAGTIIRKTIGGMKAGKEAKELARLAQEESERRLSPKAGIKLKDIGK